MYIRVSTEEQVEGSSLEVQQRVCAELVERRGWTLAAIFRDAGCSGAGIDRPGLAGLLEACGHHELDVVVVSRLDRFGRSLRHLSAMLGELDDLGVQFVSVHEAFDSVAPAGRLQRNILSSVAEFEREQLLQRSRAGLHAKARAGWWPGGPPPFGCRARRPGPRCM
jgi:site-specific DNA recombinase